MFLQWEANSHSDRDEKLINLPAPRFCLLPTVAYTVVVGLKSTIRARLEKDTTDSFILAYHITCNDNNDEDDVKVYF